MAQITLTAVSTGLQLMLKSLVNFQDNGNFILKAFTNNATLTEASVLADLIECSVYTDVELLGPSFGISYADTKGKAIYGSTVELNFSDTASIYGLYLTDSTETILIAAGKYLSAKSVESGDKITVDSLQITLDN